MQSLESKHNQVSNPTPSNPLVTTVPSITPRYYEAIWHRNERRQDRIRTRGTNTRRRKDAGSSSHFPTHATVETAKLAELQKYAHPAPSETHSCTPEPLVFILAGSLRS